ncbi:hypothetical protein Tco_1362784 [Tanacetum coccineum]
MYLPSSRPDIMFAMCTCSRFQVQPKASHMHAVKRIFIYLKGQPTLGLWYPKDSPMNLIAYSDSDYAGASIDRKSTTGAEYIAVSNCCGQTKHIEIRHHFIRDSYEKKLIEMVKIHTDYNVADLLTKAFDVTRFQFLMASIATARTSATREVELTATIDGQEKTITEASLKRHLKLEDNGGVTTLPNSEIFEQLALMGYATDSDKLTFQKYNFSPQWRFFIHTILHCLSPKKTTWEQFSSNIATAISYLAITRTFNFSKFIFDAMVKNLDNPHKFLMYPRFIQIYLNKQRRLLQPHTRTYSTPVLTQKVFSNMKSVTKGYSGEDIPLFASMITASETSPSRITSSPSLSPQHTPFTAPSTSQP